MFALRNSGLVCVLLVMLILLVSVQSSLATAQNFTVYRGTEVTRRLSLAVDDRVAVKFSVLGEGGDNTLDFLVIYPNGTVKTAYANVGVVDYRFVCDAEGQYQLNFSNARSSVDKFVSLDYEVDHYILGMPQMLFLTIVIVVACVGAVAVFILMGKPR